MTSDRTRKKVAILGAGPAGLMLGAHLDSSAFEVTIYEKNNAAGRKFLVAGDGGLNLTHSEEPDTFLTRYTPSGFFKEAFLYFNNADLVNWFQEIGVPTYIGSSGRIFPERTIKPIEVLNKIVFEVEKNGAGIKYRHTWKGWAESGELVFETDAGEVNVKPDITVFALGGASWPVTGSTGSWMELFRDKKIGTVPFQSSNCSVLVNWPKEFIDKYEGAPLKNCVLRCGDMEREGEVVVTKTGMEGSGLYPLSPAVRAGLHKDGGAVLSIDLKPGATEKEITKKLEKSSGRNVSEKLRDTLNLSHVALALLKIATTKEDFTDTDKLVSALKNVRIAITGLGPIDDAISTVGGISLASVDRRFMLRAMPGNYVIGEMLDYDAPTGGYLLQSCFSMGKYLSHILNTSVEGK